MLKLDQQKVSDYDWPNRILRDNSFYQVLNLKTGKLVAIKQYICQKLNFQSRQFIQSQYNAAQIVHGDHIIKFHKKFEFQEFIYMIWDLCDINLRKEMVNKRLEWREEEIGKIASQIVKGIKEIQAGDCVFNNMNPYNILRKDGVWRVGGFTMKEEIRIKSVKEEKAREKFRYLAPEVLKEEKLLESNKPEVWSFGIILYQMVYGNTPFSTLEYQPFKRSVIEFNIYYPEVKISKQLDNLMKKCLEKYHQKRFSWKDIQNHPFIVKYTRKEERNQDKDDNNMNISKILRDIQTSAVLETGSAEEFELFLEGKTKIEGVKMTSHTTMRFDQFYLLCKALKPDIHQNAARMLFKNLDLNNDGHINRDEFTRLLKQYRKQGSLGCPLENFLKQLTCTIKIKNIDAQKLFQRYDTDSSGRLQQKQILQLARTIIPNFSKIQLRFAISQIQRQFKGSLSIKSLYADYKIRVQKEFASESPSVTEELKRFREQLRKYKVTIGEMVKNFDRNMNDKLDFHEFKKMVFSVDAFVREEELRLMFRELDKDGSGQVEVAELQRFCEGSK